VIKTNKICEFVYAWMKNLNFIIVLSSAAIRSTCVP